MTNFTDLGLDEAIVRAVSDAGYSAPTPIQKAGIPVLLDGHDVIGIAQTGTGKTAAFVLPLLHKILMSHTRPEANSCGALILAPTRELAAQIHDNIRLYGKYLNVTSSLVVGGVKPHKQIKALARGLDILVATPGRLEDHESTGAVRLDQTSAVVLDEADQMLDMGFIPAIRRILGKLPSKRQTILLSATMPKQIRGLAHDFLYKPREIAVTPVSKPIEKIEQRLMSSAGQNKRQMLVDILNNEPIERAIVFSRTKHGANKIAQHLEKSGLTAAAIHGNKSQGQRVKALAAFKDGSIKTLVATDIAARGIDIDDVSHVINIDLPEVPEVYVHRIGRTARAGKSGVAISFCSETELDLLKAIEKLVGRIGGTRPEPVKGTETVSTSKKRPNRNRNRGGGARTASTQTDATPQNAEKKGNAKPGQRTKRRNTGSSPRRAANNNAQSGRRNTNSSSSNRRSA